MQSEFSIGQLVRHRLFGYRGVIFDVDPEFAGTEAWYENMARSRPPRDRPWYHVLVHDSQHTTYVAERNLDSERSREPIHHPLIEHFFVGIEKGVYIPRTMVQ